MTVLIVSTESHPHLHASCNNSDNDSSLSSGFITSIMEDQASNLWIASYGGGAVISGNLNRMNRRSGTFTHYLNNSGDSDNGVDGIISIYYDRSGNWWIGTHQRGLIRLEPQTNKVTRFLNGADVNTQI
jgi:ligand-binding sensor domain-containing protein